ncbi:ChaN family lipoprotein [Salidesulfovibrio brasiliensis]|uniref:ChaN family lipoprotein n=1 Tax=Salidesulfovibrio brasiliensis TaxID=221711 RepID=UPI0006D0B174|nr:ChaN family lipoprotein [Salidesulfovibrio brasiliensis]
MKSVIKAATLLLLAAFALAGCYKQPQQPEVPEMRVTFLPEKGDFLMLDGSRGDLQTVVEGLKGADYVIIGEGHTNVCDHRVQQALLDGLSEGGRSLSLGLEMVAVDRQRVLDDFGKGQIRPEDMGEELQWSDRWGYPFSLFEGHFRLAERVSMPIAGLNAPPDVIRKVSREGLESLTPEERASLPKEIIMPGKGQEAVLKKAMAMHGESDEPEDERLERFMLIQSIWDSKMAEEAVRLHQSFGWPVAVVAGSGHVEYGWGIPERIRTLDPEAVVMTVVPWRGEPYDPDKGDYSFYCPASYESRLGATLTAGVEGVYVEAVRRGSRADRSGFRPGMVITEAQGIPVNQLFDIHMAGKKAHDEDKPLVFRTTLGCEDYVIDVGRLGSRNRKEATE